MGRPKYVVATDLSAPSRAALDAALALARVTGATVDLFCAVPTGMVDEARTLLDRARAAVEKLAARTAEHGVTAQCTVVVSSDVPKSIAAHAEAVGADLVAVGPSGVTGWKKFILGSVTERMLRLAPAKLLVARGRLPDPLVRVFAAVDMTPGSARVMRVAAGIAAAAGARVTAFHVVTPPGAALMAAGGIYLPETWSLEEERVAQARRTFAAWVAKFPARGADVEARVAEGTAAEAIVAEAKASGASLVVVGSHGRSAVQELFIGSVARSVATHCGVSVLVVRTPPERRAAKRSGKRRRKA